MEKLNIDILRHGQAKRLQEEASLAEAQDLTEQGVEEVRRGAAELAKLISPEEEVQIWSSPMGRTLQTAKITAEVLENEGIRLRKKGSEDDSGIKVFKELTEVKNFDLKFFLPLIVGGEVEYAGKKFIVDKKLTNPNNLGQSYYPEEGIKHMDPRAKQQLPEEYLKLIDSFEDFFEVTRRMVKLLARLKKLNDKPYRIILVTHDALTGFIANIFSEGALKNAPTGQFINLERRDGKLVATRLGAVTEGDSDTDVVEKFNAFAASRIKGDQ
ncbi:histidine phosphatase family protein, partial [Candidatus Uhrbacteria bacterium]|nr:histidine phosphatase family protein [Candidatus Uhrbacteria bacterium]